MSYYAYDVDGYLGDVASIAGWDSFAAWVLARGKHDELTKFVEEGVSDDPEALAKTLSHEKAHGVSEESTRENLFALARKAGEILIVNEGEEDAPDDQPERSYTGLHKQHGLSDIGLLLLIILILLLLGGLPLGVPYSMPGVLVVALVVLIVFILLGKL